MDTNSIENRSELKLPENYAAGIIGALICGLAGAVVHVVLSALGFIAGISGFIAFIAAYFGYKKLAGVESSVTGIVVSVIVTLIMLLVGEYLGLAYIIYDTMSDEGAAISIIDALKSVPEFLEVPEVMSAAVKDIAVGIFLTALATASQVKAAFGQAKKNK